MQSQFDKIIFGKKKFSSILEEIYQNQKKKELQISSLINELKPLVQNIGDATLIVPLLKEYLEIGVKNDDLLIKMAALIQRMLQNNSNEDPFNISEAEKEQLLEEINKIKENK
jgi:hypothetical protein